MGAKLLVLSYLAYFILGGLANVINVLDHGAVGDGQKDDRNALYTSFSIACKNTASQTVLVPAGKTFLVGTVQFRGPCKSLVHVQVDGNIVAPSQIWPKYLLSDWISFYNLPAGIVVNGSGTFDGSGSVWWDCRSSNKCTDTPSAVAFDNINNVTVSGLRFLNSQGKHLSIYGSNGGSLSGLTITAPGSSPKTFGVYIEQSQHIDISNSTIGTGDDCISIGPESSNITITGINCGPGHGISIGSLGSDGNEANVRQINVSDCHLEGTTNGVMIQTIPGGFGFMRDITFENIKFTEVQNPIIIDQFHCGQGCAIGESAVQVQDVQYIGLSGTTKTDFAITLNCSSSVPCTGITMNNVKILAPRGAASKAYCNNAQGTKIEPVYPDVPCLN